MKNKNLNSKRSIHEDSRRINMGNNFKSLKVRLVEKKNNNGNLEGYELHFYTPDGRRRRPRVGDDIAHAKYLQNKFQDWLYEGKDPDIEWNRVQKKSQLSKTTIETFYPVFIEKHGSKQSKSMQELYKYHFKNISRCDALFKKPLAEISHSLMADYMDIRMREKEKPAKPATANREATFVKCLLNVAVKRGVIDKNPLQGFKLLTESPKSDVSITPGQIAELIQALPEVIGDIVEFAVNTGFRKDNILDLKISQVHLPDISPNGKGSVELFVKGGRWETKPINANAAAILKRNIGQRTEGYVFCNHDTGTRYHISLSTYSRTVRKLELKKVDGDYICFHDLRKIFSNWMLEGGAGIESVQYFLGHRSITTTMRYTTYNPNMMGDKLSSLPTISRDKNKKISAS